MKLAVLLGVVLGIGLSGSAAAKPNDKSRVDEIFAPYDKSDSPGCAVGVIQNERFVYRKGYGMGSLELGVPLSPESVFYMGSVSKQFTAASIVLAAEQGFLSLDDDIHKYVPELPDYGHRITLREMLHHTSGLKDVLTLIPLAGGNYGDYYSRERMIDVIARQKGLNNVPGAEYIYSNSNYFLAGVTIERATGKSLAEFAAENIFKPLGMKHTLFYEDRTLVAPGRVAAYEPGQDGKFLVDWSTNYDAVGAGGLMTSVNDMILWDDNFYANKLGKGTLLKELQTRGVLNDGKQIGYALGLEMGSYRGLPIVEHNGALFGYRTDILRFPQQKFTALTLCNVATAPVQSLARKVAEVYLAKSLQPRVSEPANMEAAAWPSAEQYAGTYLGKRDYRVYSFSAQEGHLKGWGETLARIGGDRFRDTGSGTITFESSHGTTRASLEDEGEVVFSGERVEKPRLSEPELASYAGTYRSEELEATYKLSAHEGGLALKIGWNAPLQLTPVATDVFDGGDFGTVVFHRNAEHEIAGLSVYAVNARDIRFGRIH